MKPLNRAKVFFGISSLTHAQILLFFSPLKRRNEVTIFWNEVTVRWNEVTMERSDRNSCEYTDSPRSRSYDFTFIFNSLAYIVEKVAFIHFSLFRSVR